MEPTPPPAQLVDSPWPDRRGHPCDRRDGLRRAARRFGPVAAAHALRQLADEQETASILLLDPAADLARRAEGIAACRRALERFGVLDSPNWLRSTLVRDLPSKSRAELRDRAGELLMLWAGALARQVVGPDQAGRTDLLRQALRRNAQAEACFAPGEIPRSFWIQRARLARLAGDVGGAANAEAQAAQTVVRSLKEYARLSLDNPAGATPPEMLAALAEASRQDPQDFGLWMYLGLCHSLQGHLAEAEDCFTVATVLRPNSPWPYFHRGRVGVERKEFGPAALDFDRVLKLRPGLSSGHVNRAIARLGRADAAGAVDDLSAALNLGAPETRIYFLRAEARERAGDRAGAERDRAEGLGRTPTDPESWVARGLARLPRDAMGALADFDQALRLDPGSRSALQNKASTLSERFGRTKDAVKVLDRAVALYPDFVPARVGRGVLLARLGRRDEAIRDAQEARKPRHLGRHNLSRGLHLRPGLKSPCRRSSPGPAPPLDRAGPGYGLGRGRPHRPGPRFGSERCGVPQPEGRQRRRCGGQFDRERASLTALMGVT